jgi:aminopeptidase N
VVAPASDQDNWLMEALANYSALLYLEQRSGPKAVDSVLAVFKKRLLAPVAEGRTVESMGPITWGARLQSSQAPDAWRTITYEKGSWIMHMLRRRLGDEGFLAMLGELAKRYRHRTLTSEQFRKLAAEFLPKNSVDPALETFFENWVYSTGIPTLRMEYSSKGKPPAIKLSGTLSQSGVDAGFSAWVPVQIQLSGGKSLTQWVRTDSEPVIFSVALKQAPLKVLLDPSDSVLAVRK